MSHHQSNMNKQQRPQSSKHQNQKQIQQKYDTNEMPATAYQQDEQHYQVGSDPFVMRVRQQIQKSLHQQQQQNYYTPIERESPQLFDNSVDERPNIQSTPQQQELERRTMNQVNSQTQLNDPNTNKNKKMAAASNKMGNVDKKQQLAQQEKQMKRDSSRTKTVDLSNAQPYQSLNTLQESPDDSIGDKSNYQKYQQYQQMLQQYQDSQLQQNQQLESQEEEQMTDNLPEDNYEQEDIFHYNEEEEEEDEQTEEQKQEQTSPEQEEEVEHNFIENEDGTPDPDREEQQQQQEQQQQYQIDDMDPYQYQQIVEELIQENDQLRTQMQGQAKKLEKVENQLQKTKTMLREVGTIRDDIMHLKQTAEEADDIDSVVAENEILKAKIGDLETKVSSLSKEEDDLLEMRSREKMQYENKIKDLKDENYRFSERCRQAHEEVDKFVHSLDQANKIIEIRDKMIKEVESNYKLLQDEHIKIIKENQNILSQIKDSRFQDSQFEAIDNRLQQQYTGPASGRSNPYAYQINDHLSNQSNNKQYIALRNRSSEKNNQGLSQNSQFKRQLSASDNNNNMINECELSKGFGGAELPYNNERRGQQQIIAGQSDYQPHSFNLDESEYMHNQQYKERLSPDRENRNIYSNLDNNQIQRQNMGNNNEQHYKGNTTPLKQAVQITMCSPTKQNKALVERCQKLEQYCRELIRTNKILDCENRLAIAQLIHLTDGGQQLSNLVSALNIVAKSGKIYDNNRRMNSTSGTGQVTTTSATAQQIKLNQSDIRRANTGGFNTLNISKIGTRRQSLQPGNTTVSQRSGSKSLKNLITLRSGGGANATTNGLNMSGINNTIGAIDGNRSGVGYMTQIPSNLIAQSLISQNFNVQNRKDGAQSIKINLRGNNNNSGINKQNQSLVLIKKSNMDLPLQRDQERNYQTQKQVRGVHPGNTDSNVIQNPSEARQSQRGKISERGIQEAKELEITYQNNQFQF